ncbi:MAG: ABC transporter permease [Planctomycetota bacterium]
MLLENLKIALAELKASPFRSALTTLGIVIAVAAVIAVVSIVQGASQFMVSQFESLGANSIWVWPQRPPGVEGRKLGRIELTYEDALAVAERCNAVKTVAPFIDRGSQVVSFEGEETTTHLRCTSPEYQVTNNVFTDLGRFFTPTEVANAARVCVVGDEVLKKLNTTRKRLLGRKLRVRGQPLKVVGFLEPKGAFFGNSQDDILLMPITTGIRVFGAWARRRVVFAAQARDAERTQPAVDQIRWLLRLRHHRKRGEGDDFQVMTQDQFLKNFQQVSLMITGLLIGIVSVALIVGGIGIMNIMLVSVTERTREIGIRKALGAKNRDILAQFLIEAVALGALGGLAGIACGYLAGAFAREVISIWVNFPPIHVPGWAIGIALGFSGTVGLISGLYPAWKAARLNPIEALRHE